MWSHDELEDFAAGYVLLALEPEEQEAFESHLSGCDTCTQRVAELRGVTGALAQLAEDREPSPQLRDRILTAARAEKPVGGFATPAPERSPIAWWRRFARPVTAFAAIGVLLVTVGLLSFWMVRVQDRLDISETRIDLGYDAIEIMSQAEQWWRFEGTDAAPEVVGTLAYSFEHGAACLIARNLPPVEGSRYQAWAVKDGASTALGRMWPLGDGLRWIIIPGDVSDLDAVTITLEETRSPSEPSDLVIARINVAGN